jgi:hypothetical protein
MEPSSGCRMGAWWSGYWDAGRAGAGSANGVGFLAGWWMLLSGTRLVPVPVGWCSSHSTQSWSQAGPDGCGKSEGWWFNHPTCSFGSAGLEGHWLQGRGLVSLQTVGPVPGLGLVWTGSRDPGGRGSGSTAKGQVFWRGVGLAAGGRSSCEGGIPLCVGLVQPKGQRARQNGEVTLQTYRVGIWQAGCSFIRSWCEEAFHDLSVFGSSGTFPQSGMSPASRQGL